MFSNFDFLNLARAPKVLKVTSQSLAKTMVTIWILATTKLEGLYL